MDKLISGIKGKRQDSVFVKTYRDDPVAFVHDCFTWGEGEGPTIYQDRIMADLPIFKRVCARGPHGLGKSALDAWVLWWFALTRDGTDWKVPTTASVMRQLEKYLWPEVRKWARRIRWDVVERPPVEYHRELLDKNLKLSTGEAFAVASDVPEYIEGAHADELLYIFDESKMIEPETWNAAEGAFANGEALWLATSTPGEPEGTFFDIQSKKPGFEDWKVHHVTLEECIDAGRISEQWAEDRRRQWGEDSAAYINRVLGDFATPEADGVISLKDIERANELWHVWEDEGRKGNFVGVGVDVARYGKDKTVLALRNDTAKIKVISRIDYYARQGTMETTGFVKGILDLYKSGFAVVDVVGLGAGVVDRLRELKKKVVAFNSGSKTDARDRAGELGFTDLRSASLWALREMLEDGLVALPEDDLLTGDLTAPHWKVVSGGRIQVESKDKLRTRIKRSTDSGDAVMQIITISSPGSSWEDVSDLGEPDEDYETKWS